MSEFEIEVVKHLASIARTLPAIAALLLMICLTLFSLRDRK